MLRIFFILIFVSFFNRSYGQIRLIPDKEEIFFSLNMDTLEFGKTYYLDIDNISNLDFNSNLFRHFVALLYDQSNYLIVLYVEGEINEKYSVSPFIKILEEVKKDIITQKENLTESQFIFPEYLTSSTLKDKKYIIKKGLRVKLIKLD